MKNRITYGEDGKNPIKVRADYHYQYYYFYFFSGEEKTGRANLTRQTRPDMKRRENKRKFPPECNAKPVDVLDRV